MHAAVCAVAAILLPAIACATSLEVQLVEGRVRGYASRSVLGSDYVSFSGIPYAEPPVGPLRFKAPVAKSPWDGVLEALQEGPVCPQLSDEGVFGGQEDCLYINVYTPKLPSGSPADDAPLKVMVWIHGGGYVKGSGSRSSYGPDYLVHWGVILVTFNYRLGALGFLSLESEKASGNWGLKDQVLALRWVRSNARAFGGDPDDVTLFGESAGGSSVHLHLLSPMSTGLFTRGIAQSGSALNPWGFSTSARQRAISLATSLGLPEDASDDDVLEFLSSASPEQLVNNTRAALSERDRKRLFMFVFVPSVEPNIPGAFLTEEPAVLMEENRYTKVPYLTGFTSAECNFFVSGVNKHALSKPEKLQSYNNNFESIVGPDLRVKGIENQTRAAKKIKEFYYGDSEITYEHNNRTTHLLSYLYFVEGVDLVVHKLAETSTFPVYYYHFTFKGSFSKIVDQPGVPHAEELGYLFYSSSEKRTFDPESKERKASDRLLNMWTNFVKYGNPTPNVTGLLPVTWEPYTPGNRVLLEISDSLVIMPPPDSEYQEFWHTVLSQ